MPKPGFRIFVFGFLVQVAIPCASRLRHLSYSLLPRKSSSYFCWEAQLASGDRSLQKPSPRSLSPPPGFPLKISIHCFVHRPGTALGRNVRSRCDWPNRLQLVFWAPRLIWFPCFGHWGFLLLFPKLRQFLKPHSFFLLTNFGFAIFQIESQNVGAGKRNI